MTEAGISFREFVEGAAGHLPYPYQERIAHEGLPELLKVPTGAGKTLAATLPWLYWRRFHQDQTVRASTPHWLVFVLPMRVLVEQTYAVVRGWLQAAGLEEIVGLYSVMGGEAAGPGDGAAHHQVLVDAGEDLAPSDSRRPDRRRIRPTSLRRQEPDTPVGSVGVVVGGVSGEDPVKVAPTKDQGPIEQLLAHHPARSRSKPLVKMPLRARRLHGLDIDLVVECLELTDEPVGVPFWVVAAEVVGSQVDQGLVSVRHVVGGHQDRVADFDGRLARASAALQPGMLGPAVLPHSLPQDVGHCRRPGRDPRGGWRGARTDLGRRPGEPGASGGSKGPGRGGPEPGPA